jgi:hypothetical protein
MPSAVDEADLLYILWLPGPRVFVIQDSVAHAAGRAAQLFALNKSLNKVCSKRVRVARKLEQSSPETPQVGASHSKH